MPHPVPHHYPHPILPCTQLLAKQGTLLSNSNWYLFTRNVSKFESRLHQPSPLPSENAPAYLDTLGGRIPQACPAGRGTGFHALYGPQQVRILTPLAAREICLQQLTPQGCH